MNSISNPLYRSSERVPIISTTLSALLSFSEGFKTEQERLVYECEQNLSVLAAMQVGSTNSMAAAEKILAGLEVSIARIEAMRPPNSAELQVHAMYDEELLKHNIEVRHFRAEYASIKDSADSIQAMCYEFGLVI